MIKNIKNKKKHLSNEERFCIEKMLGVGESLTNIGKTLSRGKSTISQEVNSNGDRNNYKAEKAIRRAYLKQYRKKRNCNKVALDGHLTRFVEKRLVKQKWSPETISKRLKRQSGLKYVSAKSIRKFIKKRPGLEVNLFWNRNNHKSGRKPENKIYLSDPDRKFIELRPYNTMFEYGHWEIDFIVSNWNSFVLLVCVESYSKRLKLALLPNRENDLVNRTIYELFKDQNIISITTDNDIAFTKWKQLEEMLNIKIYFTHPYHSWEKGLVENCNRWIREFIPKKTDLSRLSQIDIDWISSWFNHKPRECLDGKTAYEVYMEMEYGMIVESLLVNFPNVRIKG